jgi:DNA repair exonuclease SbcCD ATPase subunit
MSTSGPRDGVAPEARPPKKRRNAWIWVSTVLAVAAVGLLVWALSIRSDLDESEQDVATLQSQVEAGQETGGQVLTAAKGAIQQVAQQLGATAEDLEAAQADLEQAKLDGEQAEQAAAKAEDAVATAENATDKAVAEADQAKAQVEAAESKAAIAGDCAKAYVSALGALFDGESVRDQASVVREQLSGISEDCRAALAEA